MLSRALAALTVVLLSVSAHAEESDDSEFYNDTPGQLRHDEDGIPQMWGGPELKEIKNTDELKIALTVSHQKPVLIFKHSTQCQISARAAARLNTYANENKETIPAVYWLKVIETRPASNALAEATQVEHESPQILLIEDAKALWSTSHDDITPDAIDQAIRKHAGPSAE